MILYSGNTDAGDRVTAEELVPNLEAFDPSILELLPLKLKKLVEERVQASHFTLPSRDNTVSTRWKSFFSFLFANTDFDLDYAIIVVKSLLFFYYIY